MGLALDQGKLAIGTRSAVIEYRNMPAAAEKVEPRGTHDACFIHRNTRITGDVRIHDVAWIGNELWFVATAFSCLATLDPEHNFSPRWKPPFIEKLQPGDACHLNGMEVVDGQVAFVTALGQTSEPNGWRENKASGGCLIDVPSSEVLLEGLSMPHSPRVHDGRLWFLESGEGRLCVVDLEAGTYETVQELPGFTRGLAFAGPLAFVGLSQIRETATFGGLPISERLDRAPVRRLDRRHPQRRDRRLSALRGGGAGGLRRARAARLAQARSRRGRGRDHAQLVRDRRLGGLSPCAG